MSLLFIFISGLILVNALPASDLFKRDVSHLDLSYLPPSTPQLKQYLPPKQSLESEQLPILPSKEYLPPVADVKDITVTPEKPQESTTNAAIPEAEIKTESLPLTNEYLPPAAEIKMAEKNVTKQPELPANEYLPPINTGEDISEIPLEPFPKNNESTEIEPITPVKTSTEESSGEIVESLNVTPQDTAVKEADGYHYKKPDNIPNLFTPIEDNAEYLPPLVNVAVEIEGPANGESAVLENDGYHYRRF